MGVTGSPFFQLWGSLTELSWKRLGLKRHGIAGDSGQMLVPEPADAVFRRLEANVVMRMHQSIPFLIRRAVVVHLDQPAADDQNITLFQRDILLLENRLDVL